MDRRKFLAGLLASTAATATPALLTKAVPAVVPPAPIQYEWKLVDSRIAVDQLERYEIKYLYEIICRYRDTCPGDITDARAAT